MEYINDFYIRGNPCSRQVIECHTKPEKYRGFLIFHRIQAAGPIEAGAHCFDIVEAGHCVGMYAGPNGARRRVDQIIEERAP